MLYKFWLKFQNIILEVGAVVSAAFLLLGIGWWKGRQGQVRKEQKHNQGAVERGERDADEIAKQANATVQQLQKDSQSQEPPNVEKRNDLDTTQ